MISYVSGILKNQAYKKQSKIVVTREWDRAIRLVLFKGSNRQQVAGNPYTSNTQYSGYSCLWLISYCRKRNWHIL